MVVDLKGRGLLPAGFLLFVSASFLAHTSGNFPQKMTRQDRPDKSKFYAFQVVREERVQNAKDSLGAPDGRSAEILPGGQIVILMESMLPPSQVVGYGETAVCLDSGSVVGKGEADFGLEGRFSWQDTQGEQHHEWIPLVPSATGFCISPPPLAIYSPQDNAGVDMIKITNPGATSLFVDAVIGYEWMSWRPEA